MSGSVARMNMNAFKDCVLFSVTVRQWGNRAQVKNKAAAEEYLRELRAAIEADEDLPEGQRELSPSAIVAGKTAVKNRMGITIQLIASKELDALKSHMTEIKKRATDYSMPSFVRSGMFVVHRKNITTVEEILETGKTKLDDDLLPAFLSAYPVSKEEAKTLPVRKGGLGPCFFESNYPSAVDLARKFGIDWNWLSIDVAEGLPPELLAKEQEKLQKNFSDAASQIQDALRMMFAEIIQHATEQLKYDETTGKPKVFRDSMVEKWQGFFDTFEAKNIMNDTDLAMLVDRAKAVVGGVSAKQLRQDISIRDRAQKGLEDIKEAMAGMVEEIQSRAFDFSMDEVASS